MRIALLLILSALPCLAATVRLEWNANSETDLAGYKVYWGTASRVYPQSNTVATTTCSITNLPPGRYYFAVTAFLNNGLESDYSIEVPHVIPVPPPVGVRVTIQSASALTGPWTNTTATAFMPIPAIPPEPVFFRAIVTQE